MNDLHSNFSNPILPCGPVYDHAFPPPFYGHPILWDIVCDTNIQVSLLWLHTLCGKQDELPYTLNILDNQAYVCSPICTRFVEDTNDSCSPCAALGPSVAELGKTILHYQPCTRWSLKNIRQQFQAISEHTKELEY